MDVQTKTETRHTAEFLISEAPGTISRDAATVTVPAGETWLAGKVLAQLDATGKWVEYDDSGSDGSESAAGVLLDEITNSGESPADFAGVVINFCAEVRAADLGWKSGLSDASQLAGLADLKAKGVKAR